MKIEKKFIALLHYNDCSQLIISKYIQALFNRDITLLKASFLSLKNMLIGKSYAKLISFIGSFSIVVLN